MAGQEETKRNRSLELCRRTVTTESFIEEAKAIYGDRYDYRNVVYKNSEHRVSVTCPVHGDFLIYAREHLDGKGCPKCEKGEKFLKGLRGKFGDKFGLEAFVYKDSTTPVTLICPKHGAFSKLPYAILNSRNGCPQCGYEQMLNDQRQTQQEAQKKLAEKKERLLEEDRVEREEAAYYWSERICNILSGDTNQEDPWYFDFFGFNLLDICSDNGEPINGRASLSLDYSHYPFHNAEIVAVDGDLIRLTLWLSKFECPELDSELLAEILLVCGSLIFKGARLSLDKLKEKCSFDDDNLYKYEGVVDGFKLQIVLGKDYVELKIRSVSSKTQTIRNNRSYTIKTLPKSFVGIDFETLYPQRVSACSIGLVKYIDGVIVDRYYSLIRPPFDYPGKCGRALTWVHGLTEEMVQDAKTFAELLPEIEAFVDGLPLVAHNACVERACIREASAYYGIGTKLDFENIFDTLVLSRQAEEKLGICEQGPGTHQLDTVCKRFGISGANHHNALADAEMTGNLMVVFEKILVGGEKVEIKKTASVPREKYNPEDKIQRTDLDCVADNPFKNQVIVLTGFAKADSQEYAHKLNELGAIIKDSVSGKTNILITGYNAGPSKMQKAQELGIRIIPEEEFLEIIKQL